MTTIPNIPDHTLLRPIGRGAYGEVWLARNIMGAARAVKLVWRRQFQSDRPYEREFAGIQRYEPVSRSTDGLVHVLHVGRNDDEGYFYYVMEPADPMVPVADHSANGVAAAGDSFAREYFPRTLRSELQGVGRLPLPDCLRLALDVVGGLARLHAYGLVHRDVKPGNIIFVNGRAKLADIGLVSTGGEGRTFVGTEGYIPPEGPGSPAADLYALGMVLYEAVTGYSPDQFPKVPTEWFADETGPEPLEFHEVVLKACEGAKERRYASAEEMQADLALLQSGQSVRRLRALEERVTRWRRVGWVAGVGVALAVATALVSNWRTQMVAQSRAKEAALREAAQHSLARAELAEQASREQLNVALFEQARALVLSREIGHRTRALEAIQRVGGATNLAELRRIAFAALAVPDLRLERELPVSPALTLLQPDPGFERVAMGSGSGPISIRSLPELAELATLPPSTNRPAYVGFWSPDGRYLAIKRQHDDAGVRCDWEVWNVDRKERVLIATPDIAYGSVTFHPVLPRFMAGRIGGRVVEWNLETGEEVRSIRLADTPSALAYSPDGKRLVTNYRMAPQWVVAFHDAETLEQIRAVEWPEPFESVVWHPQGRWVSGCGMNATSWARGVRLIEANTGQVTMLGEHKIKLAMCAFAAGGNYLVTGGWDREIICWDLWTSQRAFTYAGTGYRHSWSADGSQCAVVLPESILQLFRFEQPSDRNLAGQLGDDLQSGKYSPDGRWLVIQESRHLLVWNLDGDAPVTRVAVPSNVTTFFSADSTELFAAPFGNPQGDYFGRWRLTVGANLNDPPKVEAVSINTPSGVTSGAAVTNRLIMTSAAGVHFLHTNEFAAGGGHVVRVPPGLGWVSADGRWLAMLYGYSPDVRVYRLSDMEEVAHLQTGNLVGFITFSPNGDEMLVLNRGGIEWFETTNWQRTRRQSGTPVSGSYAFYTPDGKGIWMITHFRNAVLVDRDTLQPLLPLPRDLVPLALSPDGKQLAFSVNGQRVQLRDMEAFRLELAKLGLDW